MQRTPVQRSNIEHKSLPFICFFELMEQNLDNFELGENDVRRAMISVLGSDEWTK